MILLVEIFASVKRSGFIPSSEHASQYNDTKKMSKFKNYIFAGSALLGIHVTQLAFQNLSKNPIHISLYIYIYIYMCVCVCVFNFYIILFVSIYNKHSVFISVDLLSVYPSFSIYI